MILLKFFGKDSRGFLLAVNCSFVHSMLSTESNLIIRVCSPFFCYFHYWYFFHAEMWEKVVPQLKSVFYVIQSISDTKMIALRSSNHRVKGFDHNFQRNDFVFRSIVCEWNVKCSSIENNCQFWWSIWVFVFIDFPTWIKFLITRSRSI